MLLTRFGPAALRMPTMLIIGEWGQDTPLYMAQDGFCEDDQLTRQALRARFRRVRRLDAARD
jgi:hypothetical protein